MSTAKPIFTFWRVMALLVLLAIAGLAALVITSAMARPTISVDYTEELESIAREYQPEHASEPNRRDDFIATILDMNRISSARFPGESIDVQALLEPEPERRTSTPLRDEPTWEQERQRAEEFLNALDEEGFFDRAQSLSGIRHAVNEIPQGMSVIEASFSEHFNMLEHLGPMRQLTRVLSIQAVRDARAGRTDDALANIESAFATARLASTEPFLISGLVGVACHAVACSNAIRIVTEHRLTSEQLDELARIADRQRTLPFEYAIRTEKTIIIDAIQRTYSDNGKGDGHFLPGYFATLTNDPNTTPIPRTNALNVVGRFMPSRARTVETIDNMFDAAIEYTRNPSHNTAALDSAAEEAELLADDHLLLGILLPAINRSAQNAPFVTTYIAALRTAIALEHYFLDTNAYPETLDALVPTYLDHLPEDPTARDNRLIYTPSQDRATYTLHAVGRNKQDNNGEEDDITFTPE
ncbi:unnamed protein product [Symbiodinium necroappetens]|uniref:Uncharacterized protein n=1 Tax=Symbiodinium necroappetens TaxID=1628268 RepID=A0A812UHQ3_9DINO|nr:unnamed protein product [Symbiodinium necroappetens]